MKSKPYRRKPGDFEIRILSNGQVIMLVPDEKLLKVAQAIEPKSGAVECFNGDNQICRKLNQ
jgi:hypothetical protein